MTDFITYKAEYDRLYLAAIADGKTPEDAKKAARYEAARIAKGNKKPFTWGNK